MYVVPLITKLSNTVSEVGVGVIPPITSAVPNPILYTYLTLLYVYGTASYTIKFVLIVASV